MRRRLQRALSRRDFLSRASRFSAAGLLIGMAGTGCSRPSAEAPAAGVSVTGLPRLPEGSPDLDLINSLLQLERRAVALASEARGGQRLGDRAQRAVDRMIDDHNFHVAVLEKVIHGAGATPDPPRIRYSLPTPLGDERRALGTLLEDEVNLARKYAVALERLQAFQLARSIGSLLFSTTTHWAALERLLDRCKEPTLDFMEVSDPTNLPASSPVSTPVRSSGLIEPGAVLEGLVSIESASGRLCRLGADWLSGRWQAAEQRASSHNEAGQSSTAPSVARKIEVRGFCVVSTDAEGRVIASTSAQPPTADSILSDNRAIGADDSTVLAAAVSLLRAMSSAHSQRASYWAAASGSFSDTGMSSEGRPSPTAEPGLPEELSPTAAGIDERAFDPDKIAQDARPSDVARVIQDSEIKTAKALVVAASNLASAELRSRIASAVSAVATGASRIAALVTGEDLLVAEV